MLNSTQYVFEISCLYICQYYLIALKIVSLTVQRMCLVSYLFKDLCVMFAFSSACCIAFLLVLVNVFLILLFLDYRVHNRSLGLCFNGCSLLFRRFVFPNIQMLYTWRFLNP